MYYHRLEFVDNFNIRRCFQIRRYYYHDERILRYRRRCTAYWHYHGPRSHTGYQQRQPVEYSACAKPTACICYWQRWGIHDDEVVVFGDGGSDIEMLRQAGFGYHVATPAEGGRGGGEIPRRIEPAGDERMYVKRARSAFWRLPVTGRHGRHLGCAREFT